MPELPDVEVCRRYLTATALHQRIAHTRVAAPALLAGTTPQGLGRVLKGRAFTDTARHGKYLFGILDRDHCLVLHFGMTGELQYFRHRTALPAHTQCLLRFAGGFDLAYVAPRKLGRIALADSPAAFVQDQGLGPDALTLTEAQFAELASRRAQIKCLLMDQRRIAGIGNLYSDEILFQARVHPRCRAADLDAAQLRGLHRAIGHVLQAAIAAHADAQHLPGDFLLPQRRPGGRCPRCDSTLQTVQAAGRSAWFCPRCQPR
jgi:formamidopyrimidine-DNA glycosylase